MTDPNLEEIRRQLNLPVAPSDAFAHSLLARIEAELAATAMSADEIDAEGGEELPLREAMSVISPDPIGPVDPGAVLGDLEPGTGPQTT